MNLASEKKPTTSQPQIFGETDFPGLTLYKRGNRKDLYDLGENLLVVTKDRIASAPAATAEQIPGIGRVVNQFSTHWFKQLEKLTPNHFISADINQFPDAGQAYAEQLEGRSMLVKKMTPLPVKCLVRGYLTGQAWQEYQESGGMAGIELPAEMVESQRLPAPLFIPLLEGGAPESGFAVLEERYGRLLAEKLSKAALQNYFTAWKMARYHGVLLVETIFEFGLFEGGIYLIDECITPATSRFWSMKAYEPGRPMPFWGEEYLPSSRLPLSESQEALQHKAYQSYHELYLQLTGQRF